jgi:dimethylaniline monooxygenase (N-oxide forming)
MVQKYLQSYAEYFGSDNYIRFNHEVLSVKQADDHSDTGKWLLVVMNKNTKTTSTEMFDAVLVCTGHHADKRMAHFDGRFVCMTFMLISLQIRGIFM